MSDLLVVVDDIAEMVAAGIMGFADAHGVVGEVDVAVVAEEIRHVSERSVGVEDGVLSGKMED